MKRVLNIKIHPVIILVVLSPLFWLVLVVVIYGLLMFYWLHKMFLSADKHVTAGENVTTGFGLYASNMIYRKKLKKYWIKIKPFSKN